MNNKFGLFGLMALITISILNNQPAQAEMFKCVSLDGAVFYNDKPCDVEAKETLIKADKAPKGGYTPSALASDKDKQKKDIGIGGDVQNKEVINKNKTSEKEQQLTSAEKGTKATGNASGGVAGATSDQQGNSDSDQSADSEKPVSRSVGGNPESASSRTALSIQSANATLPRVSLKVESRKRDLIDR